jgi:Flp pilus assembly protein CpaB
MVAIIVLIRNLVLAGILAWLGIEFAPADRDDAADNQPTENVLVRILG